MILAEKIYQKFINIKSKNLIKDFFLYFDEHKSYTINIDNGYISFKENPCNIKETFIGEYYMIWPDDSVSIGKISSFALSNFEDFFLHAQYTKIKTATHPFIPSRGIFPLAMTYSKPLADLIDIPEYFMKVSDVVSELQTNLNNINISTNIIITQGTRYIYSSKYIDENYIYTDFKLKSSLSNELIWNLNTTEIIPLSQIDEILTIIGDIYTAINEPQKSNEDLVTNNILITPQAFQSLFKNQVIEHLYSDNIIGKRSKFTVDDFINQEKRWKKFTLTYDPTLRYKPGSCKFNKFGVKPSKHFLIKDGKLISPFFTDNFSHSTFQKKEPAPYLFSFSNLEFNNITVTSLNHLRKRGLDLTEVYKIKQDKITGDLYTDSFLKYENSILKCFNKYVKLNMDLIDLIEQNKVELVQFNNYEFGCVLKSINL